MKIVLLILACAGIAGCYGRHEEVLIATRDPLFNEWLVRNRLVLRNANEGSGCTLLAVRKEAGAPSPVDTKAEGEVK